MSPIDVLHRPFCNRALRPDFIVLYKTRMPISDTSGQDRTVQPKSLVRKYALPAGLALLLLVALVVSWPTIGRWLSVEKSVSADRIRTAMVKRGDLIRDASSQGKVVAGVSPTLYAPSSGIITFEVGVGQAVAVDDVVARIESEELVNMLSQQRAEHEGMVATLRRAEIDTRQKKLQNRNAKDQAQVQLTAAKREARRAQLAYEQQAISQLDFEKAMDELRSAELNHAYQTKFSMLDNERLEFEIESQRRSLERQALALSELERKVDELAIRSPISGTVGQRLIEPKTYVMQGSGVLTVVDLSGFEVESLVPETYADSLSIGLPAEVRIGTRKLNAELVSMSPQVVDNNVQVRLRFIGETPGGLRQNQRLTTTIFLERYTDTLIVERGQFVESGSGRTVYVVKDGIAKRRNIKLGAMSLSAVQILSGVQEGEAIITSNTDAFDDADSVLIN